MLIFLTGTGLLATALLIHLGMWHLRLPRQHTAMLLAVFAGVYLAALPVLAPSPALQWIPLGWIGLAHVSIYYFAIAISYVNFYSIIEEDSPSLRIVKMVYRSGTNGMGRDEIALQLGSNDILKSRLLAAVNGGLITVDDSTCHLTKKGMILARLFLMVEVLLSLEKGG